MSHIEIKHISGNDYAYLRTNYRLGKRVKHYPDKYLGAVSLKGRIIKGIPEPKSETIRREPIEPIKEIVKPIIKEPITRIKKVRRIKFKLPKAIRALPPGIERETTIEEIKKKKKIKKKIKTIKKKVKKISDEETKKLFTFV